MRVLLFIYVLNYSSIIMAQSHRLLACQYYNDGANIEYFSNHLWNEKGNLVFRTDSMTPMDIQCSSGEVEAQFNGWLITPKDTGLVVVEYNLIVNADTLMIKDTFYSHPYPELNLEIFHDTLMSKNQLQLDIQENGDTVSKSYKPYIYQNSALAYNKENEVIGHFIISSLSASIDLNNFFSYGKKDNNVSFVKISYTAQHIKYLTVVKLQAFYKYELN